MGLLEKRRLSIEKYLIDIQSSAQRSEYLHMRITFTVLQYTHIHISPLCMLISLCVVHVCLTFTHSCCFSLYRHLGVCVQPSCCWKCKNNLMSLIFLLSPLTPHFLFSSLINTPPFYHKKKSLHLSEHTNRTCKQRDRPRLIDSLGEETGCQ